MKAEYKFNKFNKDTIMNFKIKLTKSFKIRLWIATRLLWAAAFILGASVKIEME